MQPSSNQSIQRQPQIQQIQQTNNLQQYQMQHQSTLQLNDQQINVTRNINSSGEEIKYHEPQYAQLTTHFENIRNNTFNVQSGDIGLNQTNPQ